MELNYTIGQYYRHNKSKKKRLLIEVDGYIFRFSDDHWCTDCVFMDYVNCKTGILVSEDLQQKLFI